MPEPRNIELFNRVVGITLVQLYEQFPAPFDLDALKIGSMAAVDAQDDEETFDIIAGAEHSISFLVQEGFVSFQASQRTLSGSTFPAARLTRQGFSLLGSMPSSVDPDVERRPFFEQFKGAVEDGASATLSELVKSFFSFSLTAGAAAATSVLS